MCVSELLILLLMFICGLQATTQDPLRNYIKHECIRSCTANTLPKTCEYHFTVEEYHVLSKACYDCPFNQTDCFRPHCVPADGFEKSILTVNRMMPGPSIKVCKGDTVIITLQNVMHIESTSLHSHGIHQVNTPHHDGVPMVTQCPIHPGNSFTYRFKADPAGTHFWHSHTGFQRADGLYGALIVREPDDPHLALYDHDLSDHVILVQDWMLMLAQTMYTGFHHGDISKWSFESKSMVINGMGSYEEHVDTDTSEKYFTPRKVFTVEAGKRYRFRVISNNINCPVLFSVDNHKLLMIASDGQPFEPYEADALQIEAGERYDFVLNANFATNTNHWIRVHGLWLCKASLAHQEAILRYKGAPEDEPEGSTDWNSGNRDGVHLNALNENLSPERIPIDHLNHSLPDDETPDDKWNQPEADVKHYLGFDINLINNPHFHHPVFYPVRGPPGTSNLYDTYTPQVNHITFKHPPAPVLTQPEDIPEDMYCDVDSVANQRCNETFCECIHRIKVNLGQVVEFILIDKATFWDSHHPFHLHGYNFRVVGMSVVNPEGVTLEGIMAMDERGEIPRKLERAVKKDTVTVPNGGYAIIRFHATNPGFWLFHCHVDFHHVTGMALIVQVGEISDMQKKPKNFPRCGNWRMEGYEDETEGKCVSDGANNVTTIAKHFYLSVIITFIYFVCTLV